MLSSGKCKPLWSIFSRMVVKLSTSACKAQKWEEKRKRKIPISLMSCSLVLHQKKGLRWDNSNEGYFSSGRNKRERGHLLAAEKQHFHKAACHVTLSSRFLIGVWLGCFRLTFTSASAKKACCYVLLHCRRPRGSQL